MVVLLAKLGWLAGKVLLNGREHVCSLEIVWSKSVNLRLLLDVHIVDLPDVVVALEVHVVVSGIGSLEPVKAIALLKRLLLLVLGR